MGIAYKTASGRKATAGDSRPSGSSYVDLVVAGYGYLVAAKHVDEKVARAWLSRQRVPHAYRSGVFGFRTREAALRFQDLDRPEPPICR